MKINRLASTLRIIFGVARIMILLAIVPLLIVWCVLSFLPPSASSPTFILPLPPLSLSLPREVGSEGKPISPNHTFMLNALKADITLNLRSSDTSLTRAVRYTVIPLYVIDFIFAWLSLGLLRGLCARAEKGEIFSETNLRSVHNVGVLLLATTALEGVGSILIRLILTPHLSTLSLDGLNARLQFPWLQPSFFAEIVVGLLVLLLAEAFRQGLALQKENELTV